jgi:hypothetical protein
MVQTIQAGLRQSLPEENFQNQTFAIEDDLLPSDAWRKCAGVLFVGFSNSFGFVFNKAPLDAWGTLIFGSYVTRINTLRGSDPLRKQSQSLTFANASLAGK